MGRLRIGYGLGTGRALAGMGWVRFVSVKNLRVRAGMVLDLINCTVTGWVG